MGVYERRLMIVEMLSVAKRITYHYLAQELSVSVETIRTDIIALMCIYPIEITRGRNGALSWRMATLSAVNCWGRKKLRCLWI